MQHLQYPNGKSPRPQSHVAADVRAQIESIAGFPALLNSVAKTLNHQDLITPYRPGGWTAAQVVHHIYDSHSNAFIRFKLALTEDKPTIKPYNEADWAKLADGCDTDIHHSLALIEHLHARWTTLLNSITEEQWHCSLHHPEHKRDMPLYELAAIYSWHGMHHLAHILLVKNRRPVTINS